MLSTEPVHMMESFTIKPGKLQEFYAAVNPLIMKLEKTDAHVYHIFAVDTKKVEDLDHVVLIAKFFNEDSMDRVRGSPPFVEMTKKIDPLLEEPSEFKYGRAVLGFENRER